MNVFEYTNRCAAYYHNMKQDSMHPDYKDLTTSWQDLSIGEFFGTKSLQSTFNKLFAYCKRDFKMLVELEVVCNWKMWQHEDNITLLNIYNNCYTKVQEEVFKQLEQGTKQEQEEKAKYHFALTD